jgi:dTDP-4-amino-4,6-dideoxygalactose transaminase
MNRVIQPSEPTVSLKVPYTAFAAQIAPIKAQLLAAVERVMDGGRYVLGPNIVELERQLAEYLHVRHAVAMSSGTSALELLLKALGAGPGDEVVTVPNSFVATAAAIATVGARPVFVDVSEDMNLDPSKLELAVTSRTKGIIVVHLTGRPAKMPAILEVARRHGLFVIEDSAQAIGASLDGRRVGGFGDGGAFSCHPLKNLFAFGDSGFVTTNDDELYRRLWMSRSHGMPNRDTCDFWAHNARMDELHAAMLLVNLTQLRGWTERRRELAFQYNEKLKPYVTVPEEAAGQYCVYQTYMIQAERRDALQDHLREKGIEALTHYRVPLHLQPAARALGYGENVFPVTERLCRTILSLPLYPTMTEAQQDYVVDSVARFYEG